MRSFRRVVDFARDRPGARHAGALLAFGAIFCALLLPKLLPLTPGRVLSNSPADAAIALWSLGWWPHAIGHGQLLPYTYDVYAPAGTNLAWTTSMPTAGISLAPLTHAFGPFVSFNLLAVVAPVTAAWTTYLLVHRITRRWRPAFVAGLLYALSPLETGQVAVGHLNLSLTASVPLAAYFVVRRMEGSISPPVFVAALGATLAAQLGVSTEIFATGTIFGALALVLLFIWDRARRPMLRRCAAMIALSYAVAAAIASPLLYAAFALPHPPGLVGVSGSVTPFSGVETHLHLHAAELAIAIGLGMPLFVTMAWLVWRGREQPVVRALAATALVALVCAPGILVIGTTTVPTPWTIARLLPFLRLVRPQRLTMFAWLIAAVGAGAWLAGRTSSWRRWGVCVTALAVLLPAVFVGRWTSVIPPTPLGTDPPLLCPGSNVAVVAGSPQRAHAYTDLGVPLVWQVASRFSFRVANAYVGSFPPVLPLAIRRFEFGQPLSAAQRSAVVAWIGRTGVSAVVVVSPIGRELAPIRALLGTTSIRLPGAAVLPVSGVPSCSPTLGAPG